MFNAEVEFGDIKEYRTNIYLLKIDKRSKKNSKASVINGDDNFFKTMLNSFSEYLMRFKDKTKVDFNPIGHNTDDLPILSVKKVQQKLYDIISLTEVCESIDKKVVFDFNKDDNNLIVTQISTDKGPLFFISRYQSLTKAFAFKNIFLRNSTKMQLQKNEDILAMNYNIDVAVFNEKIYIFNIGNFKSIFSYDEDLKIATNNILPNIKKWNILANVEKFLSFVDKKYFYKALAKIADDSEYLELIEKSDPIQVKNKLLLKSDGNFIEEDFNKNGQLVVTDKNCKKIIKMISKEYRYNVFKDTMEE